MHIGVLQVCVDPGLCDEIQGLVGIAADSAGSAPHIGDYS